MYDLRKSSLEERGVKSKDSRGKTLRSLRKLKVPGKQNPGKTGRGQRVKVKRVEKRHQVGKEPPRILILTEHYRH